MLRVLVLDADGHPVSGVPVEWEASAGTLAFSESRSSTNGIAAKQWRAPGSLGSATVTATAGAVSVPLVLEVVAGPASKLDVLEDSIRFTAQGQKRIVRLVGWDQYGHPATFDTNPPTAASSVAAVTALTSVGDTAYVELMSMSGSHVGYANVMSASGAGRDSVWIISEPVLAGIKGISGLDSANGLVVGEQAQLKVNGVDSLGHPIANVNVDSVGLTVSSSNPDVASTSSDGRVTAVAPGTVTIEASAGGATYSVPVTVYPVFEVGTPSMSVQLHDTQAYLQDPLGYSLTDAGVLYDLSHYVGAGALPHPEGVVLRATAPGGKVAWTRSYSGSYARFVADPPSGVAYLADPLHVMHAIDPAGTDRWTFDFGAIDMGICRLAGWKDGVVAACSTHVFALDGNGSLAWSVTASDTVRQIISAPALTVVRTQSSVTALGDDGSAKWTKATAATDMIADASSGVYVVANGVHALDASGAERWYNATALADCILATADRLVVCRNNSVITALDGADGHVRWSTASPTSFGSMAAISGDRIIVSNAFMFALDARTGAVLGRSPQSLDEVYVTVGNRVMAVTSFSYGLVFTTQYSPGSEWAQEGGSAGHSNRVTP